MAASLVVTPEANQELTDAAEWYDNQQAGLGRKFVARVRECFRAIRRSPLVFSPYRETYRRVVVRPYPYVLIYGYDSATDTATVFTVFHTSRDPDDLLGRLP